MFFAMRLIFSCSHIHQKLFCDYECYYDFFWGGGSVLGSQASLVVAYRLSFPEACGILKFPDKGSKPTPTALEDRFFTPGPSGKSRMSLWLLNLYLMLPRCLVASLAFYIYSEHLSSLVKHVNHKTAIINMRLIILVSALTCGVAFREKHSMGMEVLRYLPGGGRVHVIVHSAPQVPTFCPYCFKAPQESESYATGHSLYFSLKYILKVSAYSLSLIITI